MEVISKIVDRYPPWWEPNSNRGGEIPRVGVTWEDDPEDISMTHPSENHDSEKDGEFLSTKKAAPKRQLRKL